MTSSYRIESFPSFQAAAVISYEGCSGMDEKFATVLSWAAARGVQPGPHAPVMTIYLDSRRDTPPEKIRQAAAIRFDADIADNEPVSALTVPANTYLIGRFELNKAELENAWKEMVMTMRARNMKSVAAPTVELYLTRFEETGEIELWLPVEVIATAEREASVEAPNNTSIAG